MIKVVISDELTCPHCEKNSDSTSSNKAEEYGPGDVGICEHCNKKFNVTEVPKVKYGVLHGKFKTQCEVNTMRSKRK